MLLGVEYWIPYEACKSVGFRKYLKVTNVEKSCTKVISLLEQMSQEGIF